MFRHKFKCKIFLIIFITFFLTLEPIPYASAYNDEITHPDVTEKAARGSNLKSFLINNLGIAEGLDRPLKYSDETNSILEWLRKGSTDEDSPRCRASNHFHNPLMSWDQSYMTDEPWWLDLYCTSWSPWYSNVTWATGYLTPPPDGSKATFSTDPEYAPINWDSARDSYYSALTATSNKDREAFYAKTFSALGHVMHLLEDISVPAHVRNDFKSHLTFNGISSLNPTKWFIQPYEYYVKNNPTLVTTAQPDFPSFINTRLTDFWDADQYDGSNPSAGTAIGLAEYTNANYLSDSTIQNNNPTPEHDYPYPSVNNTDYHICDDTVPNYPQYKRHYISRNSKLGCDHFALVSMLTPMTYFSDLAGNISSLTLFLDDNVHNTYANELIPKAIGYSAALLDYFFRGDIDLVKDTDTGFGYVIVNNTEEDMAGTFEIYYDNVNDERILLWSGQLTLDTLSSGNNTSGNISFTVPGDAKQNGSYIVVFRGRLGNEEGAVAGKVVNLSETFIFLVTTPGREFIVFKLSDDGNSYALEAVGKDISPAVEFASWDVTSLLLVQSHPDMTRHVVSLPDSSEGYYPDIGNYGVRFYAPPPYMPLIIGESGPYINPWNLGLWNDAEVASGRRPFSLYDNGALEAKRIGIYTESIGGYRTWPEFHSEYPFGFFIMYQDEENASKVRGIDLPPIGNVTIRTKEIEVSSSPTPPAVYDLSYPELQLVGLPQPPQTSAVIDYGNTTITGAYFTASELAWVEDVKPIDLYYRENLNDFYDYPYIAILGKDKAIYIKDDWTIEEEHYLNTNDLWGRRGQGGGMQFVCHGGGYGLDDPGNIIQINSTVYYDNRGVAESRVRNTEDNIAELYMGDTIIDTFQRLVEIDQHDTTHLGGYHGFWEPDIPNPLNKVFVDSCYPRGTETVGVPVIDEWVGETQNLEINGTEETGFVFHNHRMETGSRFVKAMDYDHMDGGRNYIMIYEYEELDKTSDWNTWDAAWYLPPSFVYWKDTTEKTVTKYKLVYNTGNNPQIVDIGFSNEKTIRSIREIFGTSLYGVYPNYSYYPYDEVEDIEENTVGDRITGVSSQINRENMVYTYIVETWDPVAGQWTFNKRIIGVINISNPKLPSGYRQEFEISDGNASALLSDAYKELAAIGVHKGQ
jgi:hypothetical protein